MTLINKVKNGFSYVKTYWKTPPLGNYMSVKEIASLAGGGMGIRFITQCVSSVLLSATNVFVGNTIGIEPMKLYYIYLIAVIISFPLTMVRAYIVDNTRNKKGKYRPYLISMGIPTVLLSIGYFWMPYEKMESQVTKCVVVLLFNIGFQFFYNFLYEAYYNYVVVLSPNTQERANVSSVKAVVESFGPSVTGIIIPLFAENFIGTDNLNDIRIYRYIWVPILILGLFLSIIVYANTNERIIQAKTHVVQIKFMDALREVTKNKYFWITSLAGWLGFLEGACFNILNWLYSYQHACTGGQYALITTVYGNASLWGMLLAPVAIKKIGKGKTLLLINTLNIIFIGAIYPIVKYSDMSIMIWLVLICLWMNALVGAFGHILTPSINGDIRDYQQYVSGERIDGMFAAVGLIGSIVTMATSSVLPAIYEKVGFNETKLQELLPAIIAQEGPLDDPTNVYNVLYHKETFIAIFGVLIAASVIGAFMNVIPYFFYDLTEIKQQGIIKVLKIRALFEDYGNGVLQDRDLVETMDIIKKAKDLENAQPKDLSEYKLAIKQAKDKAEKKAAKKEYKAAKQFNVDLEISKIVLEEMSRFNTAFGRIQLEQARTTASLGYEAIYNYNRNDLATAKALPKSTAEKKEFRKNAISVAKDFVDAQKVAKKHFGNSITEFDARVFEKLFEREDEITAKIEEAYNNLYKAKDEKDKEAIARFKAEIKSLKNERKVVEKEIKDATTENSLYSRAARPVIKAQKLLIQAENYAKLEEIESLYEDAKARHEKAMEDARIEAELAEAEKKAYEKKLKAK
ncbi:MAG: MFS transporter [Clostridia bacterium]|nr:MFS transporter [Clostridia bacterium]MBQ4338701.1 MFS transporter [Clostridia bacterium]